MEQKETTYCNNLLLDNIDLPFDITLVSTASLLNNSPSDSLRNTKTFSDKSHNAKIENYIDQKFDLAALKHLKTQTLTEIKIGLYKNNTNINKNGIQSLQNNGYHLIRDFKITHANPSE